MAEERSYEIEITGKKSIGRLGGVDAGFNRGIIWPASCYDSYMLNKFEDKYLIYMNVRVFLDKHRIRGN